MNFWGYVYLVPATITLVAALISRRWKISIAGVIVFCSWILSSVIVITDLPDTFFFTYFAFDAIAAEIMLLLLINRFSRWNAIFLATLVAQLFVHFGYWGPTMPPRRYHEILNAFYIVQMLSTVCAARLALIPPPPIAIPPRPVIVSRRLRPVPRYTGPKVLPPRGRRGDCPALIRANA